MLRYHNHFPSPKRVITTVNALNEIAWADDKSVVSIFARKVYAERSETIVTVVSTEMPIPFF